MTNNPMDSPANHPTLPEPVGGRTFSLATILLLTTVVAVFSAAGRGFAIRARPKPADAPTNPYAYGSPRQPEYEEVEEARVVVGGAIGLIVGVTVALRRRRWLSGLLLAVLVAAPVGGAAAVLLAEPGNFPVVLAGSAVLLALGAAVRMFSR
jgi:hypothetical protein